MTPRLWDRLIEALVFVRLGQQLGTDTELAQAVAGGLDMAIQIFSRCDSLFGR
jgi:hypothetical protein